MTKKVIVGASATTAIIASGASGFGIAKLTETRDDSENGKEAEETLFQKISKAKFTLKQNLNDNDCVGKLSQQYSGLDNYKEVIKECSETENFEERLAPLNVFPLVSKGEINEGEWTSKWDNKKTEIKAKFDLTIEEEVDEEKEYKSKVIDFCDSFAKRKISTPTTNEDWYSYIRICISETNKNQIKDIISRDFWTFEKLSAE